MSLLNQCCWADCEATEDLQPIWLWGTQYCPDHIDTARRRARLAAKGPAYTGRRATTVDPVQDDQLTLIGGSTK